MFQGNTESWGEAHAVIQRADFRHAQADSGVEVALGLSMNLERCIPAFLGVAVTLVALVADSDKWLDADLALAQVVPRFDERLLGAGVVAALEAVMEATERDFAAGTALMIAPGCA